MFFESIILGMFLEASTTSDNLIIFESYRVPHKCILWNSNVFPTHLPESDISQILKTILTASEGQR